MNTETYTVTGMTCGHCVASVTEEITEIAGVEKVDVVLTGQVTVTSSQPRPSRHRLTSSQPLVPPAAAFAAAWGPGRRRPDRRRAGSPAREAPR